MSDIKEVLLTHNHQDYIGLAEQLVQESGAYLLLHRLDVPSERTYEQNRQALYAEMETWLHTNGMSQAEREIITRGMYHMLFHLPA